MFEKKKKKKEAKTLDFTFHSYLFVTTSIPNYQITNFSFLHPVSFADHGVSKGSRIFAVIRESFKTRLSRRKRKEKDHGGHIELTNNSTLRTN